MEEILKMIEAVDPSDTAKLDEIDARVYVYVWGTSTSCEFGVCHWLIGSGAGDLFAADEFTRSRDALKTIRPAGWWIETSNSPYCKIEKPPERSPWKSTVFYAPQVATEELAELHAIIQAIAYERQPTTQSEG